MIIGFILYVVNQLSFHALLANEGFLSAAFRIALCKSFPRYLKLYLRPSLRPSMNSLFASEAFVNTFCRVSGLNDRKLRPNPSPNPYASSSLWYIQFNILF